MSEPAVWAHNPFYVLALPPDCHAADIERAGNTWLAMLAIDLEEAKHYDSPVGMQVRTTESVRAAVATLHAPEKRLLCELWYVPLENTTIPLPGESAPAPQTWPHAWQAAGFAGWQP